MNIMFVTAPIAKYVIPETALHSPLGMFMRAPLNLNTGEFYGIIAEGQPKEFFKTQFLEDHAENRENEKHPVTDKEMQDNYFKIIEEAKSIVSQ